MNHFINVAVAGLNDDVFELHASKQDTLVSGDNIKTISGQSILGDGNVNVANIVYPVGSYYETSSSSFNPESAWGGTWSSSQSGSVYRWHRTA